ncbi:MAG: hypothetical protein KKB50_04680 [Planctomycetes bacterium]|nr:hypothetical protein [Planctomycetota bacterium]
MALGVVFPISAAGDLPHAVAVADDVADRVMLFDPHTGSYIGDLFPGDDQNLAAPFDVEIGPKIKVGQTTYNDTVLVGDLRNQRIVAYDGVGAAFLKELISDVTVRGLAYAPDGRLLVAAGYAGVRAYESNGTFVETRVAPDVMEGPYNAWDVLVRPFANDGQGDLLVSDTTLDIILRFDLTGQRLDTFAKLPSFTFVEQLAARENGDILAVDVFGGAVHEFTSGGTWLRKIMVTRPRGVFELFNGNLLIASEAGVQEFDGNDGTLIETEMAGFPQSAPRYLRYLRCRTPAVRGDLNGDAVVNSFDIDPFVLALSDPDAFAQQYPLVERGCVADVNRDGKVDAYDIDPFVDLLIGE